MSNMNADDIEKIDAYFEVIDERIIAPIQNTDVKKSCTATLVLLFAGIDGLGRLICPDNMYDRPNDRFKIFLSKMGEEYVNNAEDIWKVRNSLVHNGINRESYMWASSEGEFDYRHLSTSHPVDFLYINTTLFLRDFCNAKNLVRQEIRGDDILKARASNRLKWSSCVEKCPEPEDAARPSPPPPIDFIRTKNHKKM